MTNKKFQEWLSKHPADAECFIENTTKKPGRALGDSEVVITTYSMDEEDFTFEDNKIIFNFEAD